MGTVKITDTCTVNSRGLGTVKKRMEVLNNIAEAANTFPNIPEFRTN